MHVTEPASAAPCTCHALRRAARHVTQFYDQGLSQSGLRITQYALLSRLAGSGPRSIQALAQEMGLDRTTLGRNVQPLEREGLVALTVDQADRRARVLDLTAAGRVRLGQAQRLWGLTQARFANAYGAEQSQQLHTILERLCTIDPA